MIDRDERLQELQGLLAAAKGEVENANKLHSLVFLCEYAGTDLGQDFDFQYYRLYSPTLARDLDIAVESGLISRNDKSGAMSLNTGKQGRPSAQPVPDFGIVEKLCTEDSDTLEVLSVLCHLHKVGYSEGQIQLKLADLKPELKGCFDRAYELAKRLFSIKIKVLAHT